MNTGHVQRVQIGQIGQIGLLKTHSEGSFKVRNAQQSCLQTQQGRQRL